MWNKFKQWILRKEIDRYLRERNLSDLFVEIEYRRQHIFYEDNGFDRAAFYKEEIIKAENYITQRFMSENLWI